MSSLNFTADPDDDYYYDISFYMDEKGVFDLLYNNHYDMTCTNNFSLVYFSKSLSEDVKLRVRKEWEDDDVDNIDNEVYFFDELNHMLSFFKEKAYQLNGSRTIWEIEDIEERIELFVEVYENLPIVKPEIFEKVYLKLGEEVFLDVLKKSMNIEDGTIFQCIELRGNISLFRFEGANLTILKDGNSLRVSKTPYKSIGEALFYLNNLDSFFDIDENDEIELILSNKNEEKL